MHGKMRQQEIVTDIEARARALGKSISAVCRRAGVHPTTFFRWKKTRRQPKPSPASMDRVEAIYDALDAIAAEQRAAEQKGRRLATT